MFNQKVPLTFIFVVMVTVIFAASLGITRNVSAQQPGPTPQPGVAPASGLPSDNDVNRVAKKLYCPVCPNTPLDVCETQACQDWRAQIRDQLAAGWTDQQVINAFAKQYGERVLAEPERSGFTSLVWLLPALIVILGFVLVWLVLKSWRAGRSAQTASAQQTEALVSAIPREVLDKIEAEIRKMD